MRDLIVLGLVLFSLPYAFRTPFIGLLMFSWLAYMRPQDLCWGFARTMRLSFVVGLTMIVGYFASDAHKRPFWRRDIRTVLMVVLVVMTWASTLPAKVFDKWVITGLIEFTKIVAVAIFTTGQVDSKHRMRILLWTIALCLGFFGFKGGLVGLITGGGQIHRGPGGMMLDNNDFALALVMSIPMNFYLAQTEKNPLLKKFAYATAALTAITVLLTHSRGGFLSMCIATGLIAWRSGKLIQAGLAVSMLAGMFILFAPDHVKARLTTINDAAEGQGDASVNARWRSWTVAGRMINEHPWMGVGHKNFRHHYFDHSHGLFKPGEEVFNHVAHNSYLQIWAEGGTPAFIMFLIMMASIFFAARWVRVAARRRPDLEWARAYANMVETSTLGFMFGATFLNRGHFDLFYHWVAVVSALVFVVRKELAMSPEEVRERDGDDVRRGQVQVRWRPAGQLALSDGPKWGR